MRSIAVCNLKGGVGKTTSAVSIGASLARSGKRVLLIDCDPQANLTNWLRAAPVNGESTLYDVLRGQATVRSAAVSTRWNNLSVVPASPRLQEIDRGALAGERVLWARMCDDYDFVLFDCSASPGVVLANALTAADGVVIPVQAKGMALGGIDRLQRLISDVAERSSNAVNVTGILVCLFDARTRISRLVVGQMRARYADLVFDTVVHENVKLSEAADDRIPITEYAPDCRGTAEYAAVAFELVTRCLAPVGAHAAAVDTHVEAIAAARPYPAPALGTAGDSPSRRELTRSPASAHHFAAPDVHLGQD